ncbi:ABC transporter ATP-binding protein [Blastopirellula marina]|uniref:Macrolide ABC transporter ATP-binding protein n=1 Tax=Blastopirellula marina TaxID=124 RepID=A0A2S8FLF3_9BACT|nr:ABC transporter ATP-binding protein [Blastopirellula marina]PQO32996.1 macrolide ABC transporter ATP-binding protein [Blastopirellula marina]PTL43163.1 ABC transporter ATP-binding protein [Blastopirellula marina]
MNEEEPTDENDLSPKAVLEVRDVNRTFTMGEVKVEVLRDLSFDIYDGEVLAMVGPSGSGKSTILNLIGGLDQPTAGQILFEGSDLAKVSSNQLTRYRRKHVGFVFQFYNLVPNLTALENVLAAAQLADKPLDSEAMLAKVGLAERMDHFPSQLSGGEQQRVAIARAVVKNPKLLLCDEPTGALDFTTGISALELLLEFNRDLGTTILIITHNTALADVAHRVIHLRSGEIVNVEQNAHPKPPAEIVW